MAKEILLLFTLLVLEQCVRSMNLGGVLSGNRQGSVPLGIALGDGVLDVEGVCDAAGISCRNCSEVVTCIQLPSGWLRVPLQSCQDGMTCNAKLGGCSADSVPECRQETREFQHVCEQVGIFPDAYDCRKFHMCSPPADYPYGRPAEHHVAFCPRHYAYDALTAQCKIKLQHGQCESTPVPKCNSIGQTDSIRGSPNHYFVCLSKNGSLFPQIFVCPYGYYFYNNFCNAEPSPVPNNVSNVTHDSKKFEHVKTKVESIRFDKSNATPVPDTKSTTTEVEMHAVYKAKIADEITTYPTDTFLADKFDFTDYIMPEPADYAIPLDSNELSSVESY